MIKLQEFLFLFVTEVGDGGVRGNFYFSTDNDTWPKELRHNAITISELYVAIRKFDDNILDMTVKEIKERFSIPLAEGVILTTMHSAKGLEFPVVFVIGAADGLFPTNRSIEEGDVEEERRLFYVASTRAMDYLIITYPKVSVVAGELQMRPKSRFLDDILPSYYSTQI